MPVPIPAVVGGSLLSAVGRSGPSPNSCKKKSAGSFQLITAHRRRKGRNDWVCKAAAYAEGCMEFCSSPGTAPSSAMPQAHPHHLQKHRKCNEAVYARMSPKRMSPLFPLMCWWVFVNLQWGATCPSTVA